MFDNACIMAGNIIKPPSKSKPPAQPAVCSPLEAADTAASQDA